MVDYVVDGLGRRIAKKINGQVVKQWRYGGGNAPLAELDASGAVTARFVYGSKSNTPDLVKTYPDGRLYRIYSDQLGTPRVLWDIAAATAVKMMDWDSFGNLVRDTLPTTPTLFGFAGGLFDSDTKLTRFGARDYDASIGRWVSKDPSRFRGGINLYVYSRNDPVNFVDRTGHEPTGAGGASGAGEGGSEGMSSDGSGPPMPSLVPYGPYTDYNVTAGYGLGITGGVFVDSDGNFHPYLGGGLTTPGICGSVSTSTSGSVSPGEWSGQLAGSLLGAGAVGYGGGSWFTEVGGAYPPTPGVSLTGYYTW